MEKALILGDTGKLGQALRTAFSATFEVSGSSLSTGLDASNHAFLHDLLEATMPRIVLNSVALNGLDTCELEPAKAQSLNSLLPRKLALLSREFGFRLIHFSSDTVFNGKKRNGPYLESDPASPINVYGLTKFGGDCFVQAEASNYLIFRLSVLAGESGRSPQLLEKLIARARAGEPLRVSRDIVCSPSFAQDIATAVYQSVMEIRPTGLYHLANSGQASLFDLVQEVIRNLGLEIPVHAVSHVEFPSLAMKNLHTPLASEKGLALRPWQDAIRDYCRRI